MALASASSSASAAARGAQELVTRGSVEELRAYSARGGDLDWQNRSGHNLVFFAAQRVDKDKVGAAEEVLRYLIDEGNLPFDAPDNELKQTPLFFAVSKGGVACASLLLERGALVQRPDQNKQIPLFYAARYGHEACVQILLQAKALAKTRDINWQVPHFYAARYGHAKCVLALLSSSERPAELAGAMDSKGRTALFETRDANSCKALLEKKCNPNALDLNGQSALFNASRAGATAKVSVLLTFRVDVNWKDKHRQTPLHYAAAEGHLEMCRVLFEGKADPTCQDKLHQNAALVAESQGHRALCTQLAAWATEVAATKKPRRLSSNPSNPREREAEAAPDVLATSSGAAASGAEPRATAEVAPRGATAARVEGERAQAESTSSIGGMAAESASSAAVRAASSAAAPPDAPKKRLRRKVTPLGGTPPRPSEAPEADEEKRKYHIAFADPEDPSGKKPVPFGTPEYGEALAPEPARPPEGAPPQQDA